MISATTSVGMPARFRSAATRDSLPPGSSGSRGPQQNRGGVHRHRDQARPDNLGPEDDPGPDGT